ncbi:lipoxygenase homology domain-containing protein 1-like isoform X2 [Hyla sarda]|uniref:lipoxygenase homology domain-containing protein 1-like isoform X2 n=1 Tax=Hyla sarda TaxID=327740 RepID=UPI0024C2120B|nr:lipoxygenase homology domain-containing protein 1-like isoform X2 [Hyla sarda]
MVEQETRQEVQLACNCWIFADSEEEEAIKEFQVSGNPQEPIPVSGRLWNIQITTANDSLLSYEMNINVIIYGSDGKTNDFFLQKKSEIQYFYPGSRDEFLVTLKDVGEIYKICIVCDHLPTAPGWHLESINMVEQETRQEVQFECNCWIFADSEEEEAIKEFQVSGNPQEPIPVSGRLWNIQITTANDSLLSYEMNINVIIYGSDGKTNDFFLPKKSEIQYFYPGSRDEFFVTLKDVGEIYKIRIVCDHLPTAPGWHLESINMVEQETRQEVQFECNCWIFADSEEEEAIKEFQVSGNPQEPIPGKRWNIQITTANDSLLSYEMNINVIIYGSDGKTNDFFLPKKSEIQYFYPGSRDEFLVPIKDVGEIYKIRIVCDHLPTLPGWHLESINMVEQETRQEVQFESNRWIFADDVEDEAIKEFRVFNDQQELIPVNQYIVSVHTGDHWGAETLANVYITLYGERGDTGARKLHKSSIPGDKFTRDKVDSFELEAVSLGELRKVVLGHDREGYGAGMYLKMVTIKEFEDSPTEWVFPLWNWLDSYLGLCQTVCKLFTTGKRLSKSPVPIADYGGSWIIDISGSGFENAENLNSFSLSFYGNGGKAYVEVTIDGDTLQIKDELQVGTIYKVQVSWSHAQVFTSWYLSSIHMKHTVTNQEMWFNFQLWIRPNEDKCVEIPAMYPYEDPFPVVEYTISVHTGDQMAGRCTGRMYICIAGEHGDTGKRVLNAPDSDVISFTKGQVDVFTIKSVYLGQLQKIVLGFNNLESDSWLLEKIIVKEDYTCSSNTFLYNDWLTRLSGQEFTKSEILLTDSAVELNKINSFNTPTKGKWQLRVLGTPTLEENMALSVVLFGTNGKTSPQNVTNLNWDPILIRMRDVNTNQEISFYPDKVYLPCEDGFENVVEVAVVLPNQPPLEEVTYSVYVKTGDFPASSTDADVFITLYGENGDSCKRRLMHMLLPGVFCKGKISVFKIKAVELGMLSRVHIEHNAVGYGAGWYLDQITIQKSDKADIKYLFPCQRWLDTAINDKQTGCELKLLGKFNRTNEKLLTSSEGTMNIIMVTDDIPNPGTNSTVFLTICCEKGNYESVTFDKGALSGGRSMHTVELNGGLGCIQKVRLEMEDDVEDNSWFCKMVQLQHVQSGDILEFPFLQTFGSKENNFVAELPVLKPSGPLLTVKTYYISISISQAPKPLTDIDLFITLSGTMGNTGRRKVKCKRKALSSKMVGFQLKTVDIGIIHKLLIEKEKLTNLQLEKAVVEEGSFIKNKYIFIAQPWRKEKTKMMFMTLQVTETKEDNSSDAFLNEVQSMTSDGEWNIYLSISNEEIQISETLQHNLQWIILFYGDKGRSNPLRLEEQHLEQWRKDRLIYKVNLTLDLGELFKVRLGIESWHGDLGRLSLCHLKMQNTRTLDTFNQSINKTLPLSLSGDRWIEIPVEWPLRAFLSAVTYSITIVATELPEQKDQLHFGICLHGKHGDTGHRYINWHYMTNENDDESFTAILDAVELGEVHQADISVSSSNDCQLYIKRIHVKDSSKKELYVFIVDESFSLESKMPETRKEVVISQVVHDHQEETDDGLLLLTPNDKGNVEEDEGEYNIMVHTGDIKEAGTKANVYIILFYENGNSSGPVQLKTPLEDIRPFQNGKVDTFIVTTKNKGKISHIEIGHDGKGLGNGWFLEKVEIVRESAEETLLFPCNRWLAEDEDDGRTAIQLYL